MYRATLGTLALSVVLASGNAGPTSAASPNEIYRVGTDIGAAYLYEHTPRLRVTLLLQNCGETELVEKIAKGLPNSVNYTLEQLSQSAASNDV